MQGALLNAKSHFFDGGSSGANKFAQFADLFQTLNMIDRGRFKGMPQILLK